MNRISNTNSEKPNRLINEKSPYLLQHAYNPVDWYPWTPKAFKKAKKEDKPIFLSIGYSTCHWCHVMAHESFEDPEVAKLMNEHFISIKVDREERPDIDKIYMDVCQAMTGRGGWPLTIIMTPEKKPFFAATYIPKKGRFGSSGMLEIIPAISEYWKNKRNEVLESANTIINALQQASLSTSSEELGKTTLATAYTHLLRQFDEKDGGFGGAPKFPTPHILLFLLRYWKRTGAEKALSMVEKTLQAMRRGGIFDHLGFGFHRYSTDFFWLLPHFEKMLYDQALLAMAYTEGYQATKKKEYEVTARAIFAYVLRDMTDPLGGFYSAEDADSEDKEGNMVEGKFYVWTAEELKRVLDKENFDIVTKLFNIKKGGNFLDQATQQRTGENILHLTKSIPDLASDLQLEESDLGLRLEEIRRKLFEKREARPHPYKDDKILTSWNGLMIAALAKASRVLNEAKYSEAARKAVDFIYKKLIRDDGRLLHRFRDDDSSILANSDDYTFLIWGLLELYESTFEIEYLRKALTLNEELLIFFWDKESGGLYFTPDDGEELILRKKEFYDGAIPSSNSIAMWNLLRLEQLTGNEEFGEKAAKISPFFSNIVKNAPAGFTALMIALEFVIGPSCLVTIAGDLNSLDTKEMLQALHVQYLPNKIVLLNPITEKSPGIYQIADFVKAQPSIEGKTTAYVCINNFCKKPVTEIDAMLHQLQT